MSSGTGWRMISLKKSCPSSTLLSHNERASGWLSLHQNSVARAIGALRFRSSARKLGSSDGDATHARHFIAHVDRAVSRRHARPQPR